MRLCMVVMLQKMHFAFFVALRVAFCVREKFKDYFNSEVGSVSWQEGMILLY